MQLRDYQIEIAQKAKDILLRLYIVYISAEVRTGKTLMALEAARLYGAKNVLFLTKKKAIGSIEGDYINFGYTNHFTITITNNESLHKVVGQFDLVVHDESHRCFLGNTLIDGIKIKDIELGGFINSFNFAKNSCEPKRVVRIFKNKLEENLIKIKCNGKEIICTESHKIYTKRGWVEAKSITDKDELLVL